MSQAGHPPFIFFNTITFPPYQVLNLSAKHPTIATLEVGHELRSPVAGHLFRESMWFPDAVPKQLGDSKQGDVRHGGDEVGPFGQVNCDPP